MKKTKILCTVGPASENKTTLKKMAAAGMNAARINTAHDSLREYRRRISKIRAVSEMPIILDVKGPEVRIRCDKPLELAKGDVFTVGLTESDPVHFNRNIYRQVRKNDVVMIADGMIKTHIVGKGNGKLKLKCDTDACRIENAKGVNIPGKRLKMPLLSEKDERVVELAKEKDVEYIALSFTRDKRDIQHLKEHMGDADIGVIAKIENQEGIENIDEIIDNSDGVMIARGDLGVELPLEKIPIIQKKIIEKCTKDGKISIVATEMLQSMTDNARPTRAETSDVANAILDGADAVMLSAESAIGRYPVETVRVMSRIANEVEKFVPRKKPHYARNKASLAIANAVAAIIDSVHVDKIIVLTKSGYTASLISNFRTHLDVIAITGSRSVRRRLEMVYGVTPVHHKQHFPEESRLKEVSKFCLSRGLVSKNDTVLFTAGVYCATPSTNLVEIHRISEILDARKK